MAGTGGGIKASATLQARIKRMMQSDEDVGKVAKAAPVLIAKALDIFLSSMVEGAAAIAEGRGARMLTTSHIKAHIDGEVLLDFLKDSVAEVPDLPPEGSEPAKKKRQRSKSQPKDEDGSPPKVRGRGSRGGRGGKGGRGRGRGKKGADADDAEAAADAEAEGTSDAQQAARDPDGPAAMAVDGAGSATDEQQQQQQQGQQQQDGGDGQGEAAAPPAGADDAAAAQHEAGGTPAEAQIALPISIPGFHAAAAAVPGAEAEDEDYDA